MEQRYALILGNSLYDDATLARLSAPQGDAISFAEVLRDPAIGDFSQVDTLVNQPANEIRKGIARFFSNRSRDDLLLLYFSGHGVLDDRGRLFLATKDTERDLLNATAIDAAFITDAMDRSRSNRQVLILDCCHSGAFARGAKGALGASVGTASAFEGSGSGRVILTATDATQYAWEGEQIIGDAQSSVFTHHLVEGLRSGQADRNADGWIALDEWFDYVYDRVVEETPKQTPGKWSYKQQGEIWIARNPHPPAPQASLPQELVDTLADPRSWVREGAVAELDRLLRTGSPHLAGAARAALQALLNDDSRRVSGAAAAILSTASSQPSAAQSKETEPQLSSVPLKVETSPDPDPLRSGGPSPDPGSPSLPLQSKVQAVGQATAAVPLTLRKAGGFLRVAAKYLKSPASVIALLWSLGCIASLSLALLFDDGYMSITGWAIAGLIADLIIWRMKPGVRFSWLPLLTLGWPMIWISVFELYIQLYTPANDVGSDVGKQNAIATVLLLWMVFGSLLAVLRVFSVSPLPKPWSALLKAVLCWGILLLFTLIFSGTQPWETAFSEIRAGSIDGLFNTFGNSLVSYLELGLNGIIAGLVGSYLWQRWVNPS